MEKQRKGDTVRINEEARIIIDRIIQKTQMPKGKILYDSLRIIDEELQKKDYNYSKIIEKFDRK